MKMTKNPLDLKELRLSSLLAAEVLARTVEVAAEAVVAVVVVVVVVIDVQKRSCKRSFLVRLYGAWMWLTVFLFLSIASDGEYQDTNEPSTTVMCIVMKDWFLC